jgi:hypothetical protein
MDPLAVLLTAFQSVHHAGTFVAPLRRHTLKKNNFLNRQAFHPARSDSDPNGPAVRPPEGSPAEHVKWPFSAGFDQTD